MEPVTGSSYPSEPKQDWIRGKLTQLIGPGPGAFYKDACRLMAEPHYLDSTTHLVSHLLRDIESALRDVLEPIVEESVEAKTQKKKEDAHKSEITAILHYLDIPESDPVSKAWLNLAGKGETYTLHARAHRRDLSEPRALDQEFLAFWEGMQTILKIVLGKFETHFASVFDILDKMLAKARPTAEDINTLRNHVPKNWTTWSYFLGKLTRIEWLLPLKDAGFFNHPPEPRSDDEGKTFRYTMWPQSQYLARVCQNDPDQVLKVILDIPQTSNPLVHDNLADAALAMPPKLAAEWAKKEADWVSRCDRLDFMLPQKLGKVVGHLATGGETDVALTLAQSLLGTTPSADLAGQSSVSEPPARFDDWNYEQVLQALLPSLVSASGEKALITFCDLLESAVQSYLGDRTPPEDYSSAWRPAIEDSDQNHPLHPKELLVTAVRDAAAQIITKDPSRLLSVVDILEKRKWLIFQRLTLHILRICPSGGKELIAQQLTDETKFDSTTLWHEYSILAEEKFGSLSPENQSKILKLIEKGPQLEEMASIKEERTGQPPPKEELDRYADEWRLSHLTPLRASLPEEWKSVYSKLVAKFGEPAHPDYLLYSGGGVGPTSPKSAQELRSMSLSELVGFLKTWKPSGRLLDPSPEGLGRTLSELVASEPERFTREISSVQGLDPTYVRAVIGGFSEAIKKERCFAWSEVLALCRWTAEQPRAVTDVESSLESDTTWGPARKAIALLLSAGFQKGPCELPFDLRKEAWEVLYLITEDPDPTPQHEESVLEPGGLDPANLSINTVRGEALHSTIRYALWVKRHLAVSPGEQSSCGFDEMPEARAVLDDHLDLGRDPSLAIRVVYGEYLPQLQLLDKEWLVGRLLTIFPKDKSLQNLYDSTWETYLVYRPPYDDAFETLHDQYVVAVDRLDGAPSKWRYLGADPKERLAEHLMVFYWRGKIDLEDVIMKRFYEKAPASLRRYSLGFIGRSMLGAKEEIPSPILERLKKLWESRVQAITQSTSQDPEELAAFGWWFASGKFRSDWELKQLLSVLQSAGRTEADHQVINRLKDLASQSPELTVDCLVLMFGNKDASLIFLGWREQVHEILDTAIRSGNPRAHEKAVILINRLTSLGHTELRTLLRKNS